MADKPVGEAVVTILREGRVRSVSEFRASFLEDHRNRGCGADQEADQRRRRGGRRNARRRSRRASAALAQRRRQPAGDRARQGPRPGKVGLVIGGGSGHEPTFLGFVGKGLADAAAIGNVFASPPPDPILDCAKAVSGGAGVLFMYGNYAGDVMNFDMAAEMAAMDDIEVRTVLTTDDVASAPRDRREKPARRRRQLLHLQGGGRRLRPDAVARRGASGSRARPTTAPSPWASRWRPARCRRPAGRTSRSATTRWRSAWASTASPASRAES